MAANKHQNLIKMEMTYYKLVPWAQGDKYKYRHSFELEICHNYGLQEKKEFKIIMIHVCWDKIPWYSMIMMMTLYSRIFHYCGNPACTSFIRDYAIFQINYGISAHISEAC